MKPGKQAGAPSSLYSGHHHDPHAQERELREEEARRNGAIEKLDDILSKEHSTFVQIRYSCSAIKTLVQSAMTTGFPNSEVPSLREHVSNIRHMLRLLAQFSEEKDAFDPDLLLEAFTKRRERLARSKATSNSSSSSSDPLGDDEPIPPRRRRKRAPSKNLKYYTEPNTTTTTTTTSSPYPPYSSSSSPLQSPNSAPISPHPSTFSSIPPLPPELLSRSSDPSILMPPPPLPPISHTPASPVPISPLSPHPPSPLSYLSGSPRSSQHFRPPSPHPSLSPHPISPHSPHSISPHSISPHSPHSPHYTNFESHLGANSSIIHMSNPNIPKSSNYNSLQYTPSVNTNKNPNLPPYNTYPDINHNPHTFVSHQNPPSSSSTFSSRKNRETPYARGYATIVHKAIQAEHEKDSENVKLEKEKQSEKRPKTTHPPSSPVSSIPSSPSSLSLSSQSRSISPNPSAFSPSSFRQYPTIPNIQIPNEDQPSDTPYNKNIHNIFSKKETGSNKRRKERERQAMLQLNVQSYIDFTSTQVMTNTPNTTTSTTTTTTNTVTNDTSQKKSQKKEEKKMSISNLID